jgi:hypothetical protein
VASAQISKTMNFDTDWLNNPIASGTPLSTHYSGWGVSFSTIGLRATPVPAGADTITWANNTDITMGTSVSTGTQPGLGNVLHQFNGWLNEDGHPVFRINFMTPIDSISVLFTGIGAGDVRTGLGVLDSSGASYAHLALAQDPATGGNLGTQTLSLSGLSGATSVLVFPGTYDDWVGVDNITFQQWIVPAPGCAALISAAGLVAMRRRRSA